MRGRPWFDLHPMSNEPDRTQHAIPYTIHGDDVRVHANSKVYVLTCSSALSRAPSDVSRLLVSALLSRLCVKTKVHGRVINRTIDKLHEMLAWSFSCLLKGTWPSHDHLGQPLTGWRAAKANTPLAGPWRTAFCHMRGDLECKARSLLLEQRIPVARKSLAIAPPKQDVERSRGVIQ